MPTSELLERVRDLPDPTPLAWLCARPGVMETEGFAEEMVRWPETSLLKVLKTCDPPATVLRRALELVPLERLAVMAILDRQLKQSDPAAYDDYLAALERDCLGPDPSDRALALAPARILGQLDAWRARRQELACAALEQLANVPKAVSLSHAEELLSRRVYTQPGHFLFELLQNAEDARARTFRVSFHPDRIEVWHDGLPFDLRDLVGVTSIGQTTKRKNQIGFFGVGFKSVYEVTERPRIYSDVYAFEIVDVSIPRRLEHPGTPGTTLVLPLRAGVGDLSALLRSQLDPCLLLTLTHLRSLDLGDGYRIEREGDAVSGQDFLLDESEHEWDQQREKGRPDRTRLLVGVYLDQGRAVPLPEGAPSVYSYLPTSEPSGLRFLLHGHFDLPVDRERINPESAWNRWVLSHVPPALARLAVRRDLLEVLPLPGEPTGPYAFLTEALRSQLQDVPCLEGHRPGELLLTTPEIASLALDPRHRSWTGRRREVAEKTLGVPLFGVEELVASLTFPGWGDDPRWETLFALLAGRDVAQIAFVPDATGAARAPRALRFGTPELRRLYPAARFVAPFLEGNRFLAEQGVLSLTAVDLIADLEAGLELEEPETALAVLSEAPSEVRLRACRLPLFPGRDGKRHPLSLQAADWEGAVAVVDEDLAALYVGLRPLLAHPMPAWRPVALDFSALVDDLVAGRLREIPHDLLAEGYRDVPERSLRELARRPLWSDARGVPRTLEQARRPRYAEMVALLPDEIWLEPALCALEHVVFLTPVPVGVDALVGRPEALDFLLEHAEEMTNLAVWQLLQCELPDDRGRPTRVDQLVLPVDAGLRALYRPPLDRRFLDPASPGGRLLERVGQERPRVGVAELLEDLSRVGRLEVEHARAIRDWLPPLTPAQMRGFAELELWCDRSGRLGRLGTGALTPGDRVWWLEERFGRLFPELRLLEGSAEDVQLKPHDAVAVLELCRTHPPADLLGLLELLAEDPVTVPDFDRLRIWPTAHGATSAAEAVVELPDLFPEGSSERLLFERRLLLPGAAELLPRLARVRDPLELVRETLFARARPGQPLVDQPAFLSTPERVRAVALYLKTPFPLVDGLGRLRLEPLMTCDVIELLPVVMRQAVTPLDLPGLTRLAPVQVLEALSALPPREWLADEPRRLRFYAWLLEREAEVFTEGRAALAEHAFWRTEKGALLRADQLVLDPRLPDLGVDWRPHAEIPTALLKVLERQLGIGLPQAEELVQTHVLPAYREAVRQGQRERAWQLFEFLAEHPAPLADDFPVEDRRGRFRPAREVARPDPELDEALQLVFDPGDHLLSERYTRAQARLLPLAEIPPLSQLAAAFARRRQDSARGLALLASVMTRRHGPAWLDARFRQEPWLPDGLGAARRPGELYLPDAEVEALIGDHPRLYPQRELALVLGDELMAALGLRQAVDLDAVLANLEAASQAQRSLSFRVYLWLEARLQAAEVSRDELRRRLGDRRWIFTDDGVWMHHARVLGVHAFPLFGERRGYWERGFANCPELCAAFGIPGAVSPDVVREFLHEVAEGPADQLKRERPLARMLLACYRKLVNLGPYPIDPSLRVILAEQRPGGERVLLPANHPALVMSDTPTLESLFPRLYVAVPGGVEAREEVEAFHTAMGLRVLREAFTVELEAGGKERTADCAEGVQRLRGSLRALVGVLDRIKRQRTQLSPDHWVDDQRLRPLAQSGKVRVIQGLKVQYRLEGVGTVRVQACGAYHPGSRELLVDEALAVPGAPLTGLAQGIVPCVYQGPGEEQLVDILEILLPLGTRERMDAYLDARHFPRGSDEVDRVAERVGEILDFGLDRRLAARFPSLSSASWELPAGLTVDEAVELVARDADDEARQAVHDLLSAPSLDRLVAPALPVAPEQAPVVQMAAPSDPSLWDRLVGWFSDLKAPEPVKSLLPSWASGGNPFAPLTAVGTQFWATRGALERLMGQPSPVGLEFSPYPVPRPQLYAAHCLAGSFDAATQRWLPATLPKLAEGQPSGRMITFQGRLGPGVNRIPLPFFTRLASKLGGSSQGGPGELLLKLAAPSAVRYQLELLAPPRLTGGVVKSSPSWLAPTVALEELPRKVADWLARVRSLSPWEKALAAEEFVTLHYAYDPDHLEHPEARRKLGALRPGQGNHHLALLHARTPVAAGFLGHGICYELNVMVCELLRHAGVPCLIATGWALDEGRVDRPDHLFALALLESVSGPVLMPLDASMSRHGPLRPLRPEPSLVAARGGSLPASGGAWSGSGTQRPVDGLSEARSEEEQLALEELTHHREALLLALGGKAPDAFLRAALDDASLPLGERIQRLQHGLRGLLGSAELAVTAVRLCAGDYQSLSRLPAPVEELVQRGLAEVQTVPVLRVLPRR